MMSATLNLELFRSFFLRAGLKVETVVIPGRLFPVEIRYCPVSGSPISQMGWRDGSTAQAIAREVVKLNEDPAFMPVARGGRRAEANHFLVFLPGKDDIAAVKCAIEDLLQEAATTVRLCILPLHSELSFEQQNAAVLDTDDWALPPGVRKVILATNLAEAALTVQGVSVVFDGGFSKQKEKDPVRLTEYLLLRSISRSSADQRKGRAGREKAGLCVRFYSEEDYASFDEFDVPELLRTSLEDVVLRLKSFTVDDVRRFSFPSAPTDFRLNGAIEALIRARALIVQDAADGDKLALTDLGRLLLSFSMDYKLAISLIAAEQYDCTEEVIRLCAVLSTRAPWLFSIPRNEKGDAVARKEHSAFDDRRGDAFCAAAALREFVATPPMYQKSFCWDKYLCLKTLSEAAQLARLFRDQLASKRYQVQRWIEKTGFQRGDYAPRDNAQRCLLLGYLGSIFRRGQGKPPFHNILDGTSFGELASSSVLYRLSLSTELVISHAVHGRGSKTSLEVNTIVHREWVRDYLPSSFLSKVSELDERWIRRGF